MGRACSKRARSTPATHWRSGAATAADSTYAGIVRLGGRPPQSRPRLCGSPIAWPPGSFRWHWQSPDWPGLSAAHRSRRRGTGRRATPCPLLLAAPGGDCVRLSGVAYRSADPRAEHWKHGSCKHFGAGQTGTLTSGPPAIARISPLRRVGPSTGARLGGIRGSDVRARILRWRSSTMRSRDLGCPSPPVSEEAGMGVSAVVDGHAVSVGNLDLDEELRRGRPTVSRAC